MSIARSIGDICSGILFECMSGIPNQRHFRDIAISRSESYLEYMFWHLLGKCDLTRFSRIEAQVKVGRFRLDGVLEFDGRRIGIEVDGHAFHDLEEDFKRDREILHSGHVDEIIRIQSLAILLHHRAFLRPLQEWHDCFKCAHEVATFSVSEYEELRRIAIERGDCQTESQFDERMESNASIWDVDGNYAWVSSPRWKGQRIARTSMMRHVAPLMNIASDGVF